ncbi:olfactory receptor 6X1-like [Rhineura floridana]|uniref:olfactory receptor 6X1-like n=1 Tax=Rhineura floridana TaxID=261503 RepID=UPI002AC858F4|nr:olfactory receptor 6X1-like [Rhineura floridana]
MDLTNCSRVTEFNLLGFPHIWGMNITLFLIVLLLYSLSLAGNGLIIVMVKIDRKLQKPMYFFLSNLSFLELWYTTTIIPKLLASLLSSKTTICFYCCMAQSYFYFLFGITEFYILTVMSFDRYLAICQPLRYTTIMTSSVCLQLALVPWFGGFCTILLQTVLVVRLPFCGSNVINHFYCDISPMLKIAGGDTQLIEALGFLIAVAVILSSLLLTVVSYIFIISTILRIPSTSGQRRAFSTCASHLTVVSILYGAVLFIYLRPSTKHSSFSLNKAVSVLNTVITPVLNPFIYTIRNNEVKEALRKVLGRKTEGSPKLRVLVCVGKTCNVIQC